MTMNFGAIVSLLTSLSLGGPSGAIDARGDVCVRFQSRTTHTDGSALEVSIKAGDILEMKSAFDAGRSIEILDLALPDRRAVSLRLRPIRIMPKGATVRVVGSNGDRRTGTHAVAFAGAVSGEPDSFAFIGLTPTRVEGFVSLSRVTFFISSGGTWKMRLKVSTSSRVTWPSALAILALKAMTAMVNAVSRA